MKIKVKDLNRLENCDTIVEKICELDSKSFWATVSAAIKMRKANKDSRQKFGKVINGE